jgi:hypothetical protein
MITSRTCVTRGCLIALALATAIGAGRLPAGDDSSHLTDSELDQKLWAFCQESILYDRGFSIGMMGHTTDELISTQLVKDHDFQMALGLTPQQIDQLQAVPSWPDDDGAAKSEPHLPEGFFPFWERTNPYRTRLPKILTAAQQERIPEIYLQVEGLMALMRQEFQKRIGITAEKQQRIETLAKKEFKENASICYRAVFVLRAKDIEDIPLYHALLRTNGAKLDRDILDLLSRDERSRLLAIVRKARTLRRAVKTPDWKELESK